MPTSTPSVTPAPAPSRFLTADGRLQAIVLREPATDASARKPLPAVLRELVDDGIIG